MADHPTPAPLDEIVDAVVRAVTVEETSERIDDLDTLSAWRSRLPPVRTDVGPSRDC